MLAPGTEDLGSAVPSQSLRDIGQGSRVVRKELPSRTQQEPRIRLGTLSVTDKPWKKEQWLLFAEL